MLTQDERNRLGMELTDLALAYGVDFPKEKARTYINALLKYLPASLDQYLQAMSKYVSEGNNTFPSPIKFQKYLKPSGEAEAREIIERIKYAISKYGYANLLEAKVYIGSVGWNIVQSYGGWFSICESEFSKDPSLIAQARTRAHDLISHGEITPNAEKQIEHKNIHQLTYEQKNVSDFISNLSIAKELVK